jgi:hypothetical protein
MSRTQNLLIWAGASFACIILALVVAGLLWEGPANNRSEPDIVRACGYKVLPEYRDMPEYRDLAQEISKGMRKDCGI